MQVVPQVLTAMGQAIEAQLTAQLPTANTPLLTLSCTVEKCFFARDWHHGIHVLAVYLGSALSIVRAPIRLAASIHRDNYDGAGR